MTDLDQAMNAVSYVVAAAFAAPCDRCGLLIGAGEAMARLTDHSYVHLDCVPVS